MNPLVIGFGVALFLGVGILVLLAMHHEPLRWRLRKYQRNLIWLLAAVAVVLAVGELTLSFIKVLAIPVFIFGGLYGFYDAFVKKLPDASAQKGP